MPGDYTVTIRKLSPTHLDAASKASQAAAMSALRDLGGAAAIREISALNAETPAVAVESARDPLLTYDRLMILSAGVTAWTYERKLSREALEDVDEETATLWGRAILRLSRPAAFADWDAEFDQKNG